ncbi:MAG: very short patch repair endonuclease [Candidatus Omnitrophota bacterium]|jgi:DNA mismatch endonuclease (patch repair protein)
MACIHSKNTRPEVALGRILRRNKIKFRRHYKISGSPDIAINSRKIAIFVDGDFWHGHNWKLRGLKSLQAELASYNKFWANKIRNNIKRDIRTNKELRKNDWKVLRFWESDLKRKPDMIINKILRVYRARRPAA